MKAINEQLYQAFTAPERVCLFWQAAARGDIPEIDKLIDTCPKSTYRQGDPSYFEGVRCIDRNALCALILLNQAKTAVMATFGAYAVQVGMNQDADATEQMDKYIEAECIVAGYWSAWADFCGSVGIDPAAVLKTIWGNTPDVRPLALAEFGNCFSKEEIAGLMETIVPSEEAYNRAASLFELGPELLVKRYGPRASITGETKVH